LEAVLHAHQPLDAWSRARWVPLARKLGAQPFAAMVADEKSAVAARIRAVEVLTELFGGLASDTAKAGSQASSALVRGRVAWSLGRMPCPGFERILGELATDAHARVRCCALDAIGDRFPELDAERVREVVASNLAHSDKRVRQAVAHLAARL